MEAVLLGLCLTDHLAKRLDVVPVVFILNYHLLDHR